MFWWYKFLYKTPNKYVYAYSRGNKDLDGIITYDTKTQTATITKESASDFGWKRSLEASLRHFLTVVEKGFPEEYNVCCG